jgi:hypothetical protein
LPPSPRISAEQIGKLRAAGLELPIDDLTAIAVENNGKPTELTHHALTLRGFQLEDGNYVWRSKDGNNTWQAVYFLYSGVNVFTAAGSVVEVRARRPSGEYAASSWELY